MSTLLKPLQWRRLDGQKITLPLKTAVEETIRNERALGHKLKVCIGTDSQVRGEFVEFATVIVFLREKKGGFMFIHNEKTQKQVGLRERMILEVAKSVEVAYALPERQRIIEVEVAAGATALEAVRQSGIAREFPEIDLATASMGLFAKALDGKTLPLPQDYALKARDRVEIYRPLLIDPKAARQARAAKLKAAQANKD